MGLEGLSDYLVKSLLKRPFRVIPVLPLSHRSCCYDFLNSKTGHNALIIHFLQVESSFYHFTSTQTCYEKQAPLHNYRLNRLRVLLLGGCVESEGSCRMCILMFTNMSNIYVFTEYLVLSGA